MIKQIASILLLTMLLSACSEQSEQQKTLAQGHAEIIALNKLLHVQAQDSTKLYWPFSEQYLAARHTIYQDLKDQQLTQQQMAQLNYLIIAERFPERFLPWPRQVNVISNAKQVTETGDEALNNWLQFVHHKLIEAEQSNLRLNRLEVNQLRGYLLAFKQFDSLPAVSVLDNYLQSYKPRPTLGLMALSNGKEWYQSKLNYFTAKTQSPLQWLAQLQSLMTEYSGDVAIVIDEKRSHSSPFILDFLTASEGELGFDWQLNYLEPHQSKRQLTKAEQYFWLVMMETDLGIHYHSWTTQQAQFNLMKRLGLTEQKANWLIKDIVFYPAMSFLFITQ
ncbi:hypothetical protein [Pseudoalteromonas mariniglutinosa]|uniref:hypothetical protein n=1 Tax=Pseudoalteromonas mariniglutinosa TaxID=206042 RepID=UPI00384FDAFE